MKASKLAIALLLAVATNAAVAAESGTKWYEAGERQVQSQEQTQKLDSQGFTQYAN